MSNFRSFGEQPEPASEPAPIEPIVGTVVEAAESAVGQMAEWPIIDAVPLAKNVANEVKEKLPLEAFLNQKSAFRYNSATYKVEWRNESTGDRFVGMTDYDYNSLLRAIKHQNIACSRDTLRMTLASDFVSRFDPYVEYFKGLPAWDGVTDYIQQLAETVKTTNDAFWYHCFKRWIVAATGSLIEPEVVNHTAIIFSGAQGIGKTTWLSQIMPASLRKYQFAGLLNPNDKDSQIKLSECPLIIMDELESLTRKNLDSLKELITKSSIYVRRAYGHVHEPHVRRASFAGSVNHGEFLHDTTGNRRFLCFEATEIDYQHQIPLEVVYAQALHLFRSGFQYWFDPKEVADINAQNEAFRAIPKEEEQLVKFYEPCELGEETNLWATSDILTNLVALSGIRFMSGQKLGRVLVAKGFIRLKHKGRWVYALKRVE